MANINIISVVGLQVLDSRGNPTVCACVTLSDFSRGVGIAPSGASTGRHEAFELRDGDTTRYGGKGVLKAVENINKIIAPALCNGVGCDQNKIDAILTELDGTPNKSNLGANAILAVSIALARAVSESLKIPLYRYLGGALNQKMPIPMMNILNGGAHASNNLDIQEFMILPRGDSIAESVRMGSEIYHALGRILIDKGLACGVGDEGGFAPSLSSEEEALEVICEAVVSAGYNFDNIALALDVAAGEWFDEDGYSMPKSGVTVTADELISKIEDLCAKYPIVSVEDPLAEDDFDGWRKITNRLGDKIQLVGDDLFVTNKKRLRLGAEKGIANAILIKPNQIGTVSETLSVIAMAKEKGYRVVVSHRSGETEDTFIADLAVAVGAVMIKSGAPCRTDRIAKYNRLLAIEQVLK